MISDEAFHSQHANFECAVSTDKCMLKQNIDVFYLAI